MNNKTLRWLRFALVIFWLGLAAVLGPFAGKLTEIQDNDQLNWLPRSADSTQVVKLEEQFETGEDTVSSVVVYERESGITPADQQLAVEHSARAVAAIGRNAVATPPIVADDGKAMLFNISLPDESDEDIFDGVETLREVTGTGTGDLQIRVTGQAASVYDSVSVFEGLDLKVLLATLSVVTVLLLLIYRSPFLWLAPLFAVAVAYVLAAFLVYMAAKHLGLTVDGQSGGILPILVFGAGTDYALLLISRYREELRRFDSPLTAMWVSLRGAGPAILASGATVVVGLLCLLAADLTATRGLGPVGAIGIAAAMLSMLTFLPAILMLLGRRIFWPFQPRFGSETHEQSGRWAKLGDRVAKRPRPIWLSTIALLIALGLGVQTLPSGLDYADTFRERPESVEGQLILAEHFPAGSSVPTTVISRTPVLEVIQGSELVQDVEESGRTGDLLRYSVVFDASPSTAEEASAIDALRDALDDVAGAEALVGGPGAQTVDAEDTSARDKAVVIPLVLLVVFIILILLLRSLVAPILLILTVVASFVAALGVSEVVFKYIFDYAGLSEGLELLGFVFLVALGVDYNIFLVSRAREEAANHGTRQGMKRALAVTGGVITSAGIVLAATFAVFINFPLLALSQVGFLVAFGVLLDTLIVRSLLVPALAFDLGRRFWWPSKLSRSEE